MKRILITGGSGFIGTNLIEKLIETKRFDVLNIDIVSPKLNKSRKFWKQVDIRNKEELFHDILEFNPEIVVHLAARTDLKGKSLEDYDSNTEGVISLIEALDCLKAIDRVLFASSMYVCEPGYSPIDFEDYKPHTLYGESKVMTEKIIKNSALKVPWVILRPTSIWGPWFNEPYADFFNMVMKKRYYHMGSKACSKTYGYVENTVSQIISLIEAPSEIINKKVFYLGDWPAYNITEWANEIAENVSYKIPRIPFLLFRFAGWVGDFLKFMGVKFPLTSFRIKNMTTDNIQDLSPIQEISPILQYSRVDGVLKTINWIKNKQKI